jgi:hypothetical protein
MTSVRSVKWIAWALAVLFACSVTYPALAQTRKAQAASAKFTPEQTKMLEDWSCAVALNAATGGWATRYNVFAPLQRRELSLPAARDFTSKTDPLFRTLICTNNYKPSSRCCR